MRIREAVGRHGLAYFATVAAITAIIAGCGGSGGDNGGGQNGNDEVLLPAMVLIPDDLPGAFIQTDENFSTNEQVARGEEDYEGQLANLERWGRLLGYDVTYEPADPAKKTIIVAARSTVSIYEHAGGASESLANAAQQSRERDWAPSHFGFQNLQVDEIPKPDLADEVVWLRIRGTSGEGTARKFLADDFVLIREARVRALVRVSSVSDSAAQSDQMIEETARLTGIVVERIRSALDL